MVQQIFLGSNRFYHNKVKKIDQLISHLFDNIKVQRDKLEDIYFNSLFLKAAITELLMEIQREYGTTLLLISHDLSVVRYLSDRVVVMYLGKIVECGSRDEIFEPPYHPYTEALLAAAPIADLRVKKRDIILEGNLPSPLDPPKGCPFTTRCPRRIGDICDTTPPEEQISADGHRIACHIPLEELSQIDPVFAITE